MKRRSLLLSVVLALALALSGTGVGARGTGTVVLDPALRVHPYLQYGAQVEPNRRVRVVVQKRSKADRGRDIAAAAGEAVHEELPVAKSVVLELPLRRVRKLARHPAVLYISPDAPVRATGAIDVDALKTTYEQAIGVQQIWNGPQETRGNGVKIAVLDTGLNDQHPALGGNTTCYTVNDKASNCKDHHGHGSHIAGIIHGRDGAGRYVGVAPAAHVYSLKVANNQGVSTERDLVRGLQWVHDHRDEGIRIVAISFSAALPHSYRASPISAAVEQLWLSGIVVVAAAGNRGAAADATWYAPGNDPYVITVGALDHNQTVDGADDRLADFSSRGLTQDGFAKPEIVAPGRRIVAPLAGPSVTLARQFPDRIADTDYIRLSGTSMAAPVVAGVVALLLERHPDLTPDQVKWLLVNSARPYPGQADGAGVVDPARAMQLAGGAIGVANQGLIPNARLDPTSGGVGDGQGYWDTGYWDTGYWDTGYWDTGYWD